MVNFASHQENCSNFVKTLQVFKTWFKGFADRMQKQKQAKVRM